MDNIGIIIYFLLGFLLCAALILVYSFGKSQRLPEVYIQYNKRNTKLTEALMKAGVTQEQTKEVYEYIAGYKQIEFRRDVGVGRYNSKTNNDGK